jgi:hypothetical protein
MKGLRVNCIITNEEKYFNSTVLRNKLNKFGSEDNFRRFYVSKPAAKLLKSGLTIDQVRQRLNSNYSKQVDIEILYKLKLLKTSKKRKEQVSSEEAKQVREQTEINEREWYNRREKMKTCFQTWVEEMTGGPNQCQVPYGGTCIRPDIYYDNEGSRDGRCKTCPYHEFCLCSGKDVR